MGAARGAGDIIFNAVAEGAFAAVSFGALGTAAEAAVGKLLSGASGLLQKTLPALAGATVTAIADTGLNILADAVMGRDIDWTQTFATMGVDFLFSLFLNGKSGENAYLDPVTGEDIDIPAGKTLVDIDPEAARFYEAMGDTKVTGELHNSIGDMYTQYLDIPENIVSPSEFKPLETAYRNYEANATVANAAAFLEEAGKVYERAVGGGYSIESPYNRINMAVEADFAARQGTMGAGVGINVMDIGAPTTDIDARVADLGTDATDIGPAAKEYVDDVGSTGDNGGQEVKLDWDKVLSKKGETRANHINRHAVPNTGRASHGVFNDNPQDIINDAWKNRGGIIPIDDGMGGTIYNIPYKNAGYESGYSNTGLQMDYITIIVIKGTNNLITAFPSFGKYPN